MSIIDPDGRSTQSFATRYTDPNGNTILNTDDGRNDVYMVGWDKIQAFKDDIRNTLFARGRQGVNNIGWNDFWRGEFNEVISEKVLNKAGYSTLNREDTKAAQVKAIITGSFDDNKSFYSKLLYDRWSDPVLVSGSLIAFGDILVRPIPSAPSSAVDVYAKLPYEQLQKISKVNSSELNDFFNSRGKVKASEHALRAYREMARRMLNGTFPKRVEAGSAAMQYLRIQEINRALKN